MLTSLLVIHLWLLQGIEAPTHNSLGGYIEACGQEAPLIGDDC